MYNEITPTKYVRLEKLFDADSNADHIAIETLDTKRIWQGERPFAQSSWESNVSDEKRNRQNSPKISIRIIK